MMYDSVSLQVTYVCPFDVYKAVEKIDTRFMSTN